jgi:hypothetical protein
MRLENKEWLRMVSNHDKEFLLDRYALKIANRDAFSI